MPNLYIISGCNGAGKTTASLTVLPETLQCKEFVNCDEIAKGLSPLNPDGAKVAAGRLMLSRIKTLIADKADFAIETTWPPNPIMPSSKKHAKKATKPVWFTSGCKAPTWPSSAWLSV